VSGYGVGPPELAVIGWPLEKSYSPDMHNAALAAAGIDWRYAAIPVAPGELATWLAAARNAMRGVNVTIPHKQAAVAFCTEVDALTAAAGAVNTLIFEADGRCRGHNTDGPGLLDALSVRTGMAPVGKHCAVLGAGGAARGCVAQLAMAGAASIAIHNRTESRAQAMCASLRAMFPAVNWATGGYDQLESSLPSADLIVSTVPAAARATVIPMLERSLPGAVLVDLAYGSGPTGLSRAAEARGLRVVPGLEMLLWQGVRAFKLFTGIAAPADSMRDALTKTVGEWWLC